MRNLLICLLFPSAGLAAIGDPCPMGDECPPGEACLAHADGAYCTARCPDAGCPEGFTCRADEGVPVCVRGAAPEPPMRAGMGEACGGEITCEIEYFCATDGEERYCTRGCVGPGSCPDGFRCTGVNMPACARLRGLPGGGEPCAVETGCAEGLVCVQAVTRDRPLCALPCEETAMCPMGTVCQNEACIPAERAVRPGLGQTCRDDAAEPSLAGCADGLVCHVEGRQSSYCTQGTCDSQNRCPDGYGCVEVEPRTGACRRGVEDDLIFQPPPDIDIPMRPPAPSDAALPPPPGGGGDGSGSGNGSGSGSGSGNGSGSGSGGGEEEGCRQAPGGLTGLWLLGLAGLRRRRR